MPSSKHVILSLLLPALVSCVQSTLASCNHNLPGVGTFMNHATYSFNGNSLPAGLYKNTDTVGGKPFGRTYDPRLVTVSGGYLNLIVPGGQKTSPIRGAGVNTVANDILYASVRTKAIFSAIPGTVQSKSSQANPIQSNPILPERYLLPIWETNLFRHNAKGGNSHCTA